MTSATFVKRLLAGSGCLVALVVVLGATCLKMSSNISAELDDVVNVVARKQLLAGQINAAASDMVAQDRGVAFSTVLQQPDRAEQFQQQFRKSEALAESSAHNLQALTASEDLKRELTRLNEDIDAARRTHEEFVGLLARQQMDVALKCFDETLLPILNRTSRSAGELVGKYGRELDDVRDNADRLKTTNRAAIIVLVALAVVSGAAILVFIRRSTMQLRHLASDLARCASHVSSASGQISSASDTLASNANKQAGSLEETSASSQELSSMTQRNADSARRVTELMIDTESRVGEANKNLEEMVASMKDINAASEKVARIIRVIDEIAFQTNILALNAAVEAARAGEAGMGFAVVADEVRNLAQRCAQAAKDTTSLIDECIETSNQGSQRLTRVAESIHGVTESSLKVKQIVEEVNLSTQEQARGIEHIANALADIEKITQSASASAEQSASASESMQTQAETLDRVVAQLVSMVGANEEDERPHRE